MSLSASESAQSGDAPLPAWRRLIESRYVVGGGYAVAALLTITGALLVSSPPAVGPIGPAVQAMLVVLGLNLILILGLATLVGMRVTRLLRERESDAGARLHLRFMALFGTAAVAPAIIVAIFFGGFVLTGVETWFGDKIQTLVRNSRATASSVVNEQMSILKDNVDLVAVDLNAAAGALNATPLAYRHFLAQISSNAFVAAYVLDRDGRILARFEKPNAPAFVAPPPSSFRNADEEGTISAETFESEDVIRGLSRLNSYPDAYLYVVRPVGEGVIRQLREAEAAVGALDEAADNRERIKGAFLLTYIETALLVLVGAAWLAIAAANSIAAPVARLVQAAGKVATGDLNARVDTRDQPEEMAALSRAFNSMTHDLQVQQVALRTASLDAESRRQFIETVLLGVSAGVIGLNLAGGISAANRQAALLLGADPGDMNGLKLADIAPELVAVAERAEEIGAEAEEEVDIVRGAETRRLRVRASSASDGVVLTFDDITRLITAQRNAAWKDVARRIAHEIKNPLTPIQLSAERLKRKYRAEITSDLETFDRCTETIIRQVGDIGRMVDEFSAFARMPKPTLEVMDLREALRESSFLVEVSKAEIEFRREFGDTPLQGRFDGRLLSQAFGNLIKNAAEAIESADRTDGVRGVIQIDAHCDKGWITVDIMDNGKGLPAENRQRLLEPYMTTRAKGTGLGLAIVKKIIEEHGGRIELHDAPADFHGGRGALIRVVLPSAAADDVPVGVGGEEHEQQDKQVNHGV